MTDRPDDNTAIALLFARVFRDADGDKALAHLRAMTMEQALGPNVTDAHLRHLEGQRFTVKYITSLVERGRKGT